MAAKKKAARPKKKAAPKKGPKPKHDTAPAPCPDTPCEFFSKIKPWADDMATWACEVEECYDSTCGTTLRKKELKALCKAFSIWSRAVKVWADGVEDCFQNVCHGGGGPPDHTPPPNPPF